MIIYTISASNIYRLWTFILLIVLIIRKWWSFYTTFEIYVAWTFIYRLNWSMVINGNIICTYLPKLKTLWLKMCKRLPLDENIQECVDRLIDLFRSTFWINERQWFVRCFAYSRSIHLHTVSQLISWFPAMLLDLWRSTYPYDDYQIFHNNIDGIYNETFFDTPIPSHIRLSNIEYLHIKFRINDQFWWICVTLPNPLSASDVLPIGRTSLTLCQLAQLPLMLCKL